MWFRQFNLYPIAVNNVPTEAMLQDALKEAPFAPVRVWNGLVKVLPPRWIASQISLFMPYKTACQLP